jgi:hypothetical protein
VVRIASHRLSRRLTSVLPVALVFGLAAARHLKRAIERQFIYPQLTCWPLSRCISATSFASTATGIKID